MPRTEESEKITFVLPAKLARGIRDVVGSGLAASQNALIRDAVTRELRRIREDELRREFAEAAKDPLFMQDLRETMEAFASADAESARRIPPDGWHS
jgi:Arc/MetJ-type ribon-helix-helix transcriptional regulator